MSIKGSKDSYYNLETKKVFSHKISSLDRLMMSSKKHKTCPHRNVINQKHQAQN